jgi:nucleoside-diphosphate-sugar epimerase
VTGSNGFIGVKVVQALLAAGCRNLRCFVRPSSRLDRLNEVLRAAGAGATTEIVTGNLASPEDCARAARGVSLIYHLAASFDKSFADALKNSAQATRNLLEAFAAVGKPKRFVHVSSFAVYSNLRLPRGALLDETSPLEDSPEQRFDAYTFGKLKQEEIIREFGSAHHIPFVILRPGTVFGPGKRDLTGRIGLRKSRLFLHVGGSNLLPLSYVDNCADAVVLAGLCPGVEDETFNVVDDELLTSRQFLQAYRGKVGGFITVPVPYFAAYILCALWETCAGITKKLPPVFNRRRCAAEWKGNRFTNRKLHERLGWKPRVALNEAMSSYLGQFETKTG